MRKLALLAAMAALSLSGCTTLSVASAVAANLTTVTQVQVTTLGDAILVSDAVTKAADAYLTLPSTTQAQAQAVLNGLTALHSDVAQLQADQAAGKPLTFDAFNLALKSFSAIKL